MTVTMADAIEMLEQAVQERGEDYVYPDEWKYQGLLCQYVIGDGTPGCIVGTALINNGVISETQADDLRNSPNNHSGIVSMLGWLGIKDRFDFRAINVLGEAQSAQDNGKTWGEALERAKDYMARLERFSVSA